MKMKNEIWQDGTGNYLKVLGGEMDDFSERIFSYQDIPGFLPMEVRRINGEKELFYPVSGKIALGQYLSQTGFDKEDIRRFVREILDMADQLEEYLLDCNGLVLDEDLLFVDQRSGELEGIYVPGEGRGLISGLGGLLESVMEKMDHKNRELVFFVYGMHTLTKEAGCTRDALREYVSEEKKWPDSGWAEGEADEEKRLPGRKASGSGPSDRRVAERKKASGSGPADRSRGTGKKGEWDSFRGYIVPGIILLCGVLCALILWNSGVFRTAVTGQVDRSKLAGAAAFLAAVTGYGMYRTAPRRENSSRASSRRYLIREREEDQDKRVCLIPQKRAGEPLPVKEFPFRIENVKILRRGDRIVVVDEESDQGSFVNDRRLVPWEEFPVQDGDLIQLTDNEYIVEITQSSYVM